MRIYTLWEEGGEVPWLVNAVDEYTVEDVGWPEAYDKDRAEQRHLRRELIVEISDDVVTGLFRPPVVKVKEEP